MRIGRLTTETGFLRRMSTQLESLLLILDKESSDRWVMRYLFDDEGGLTSGSTERVCRGRGARDGGPFAVE